MVTKPRRQLYKWHMYQLTTIGQRATFNNEQDPYRIVDFKDHEMTNENSYEKLTARFINKSINGEIS